MTQFPEEQLRQWGSELRRQISDLEAEVAPKLERLADLRTKLKAIEQLIGPLQEKGVGNESPARGTEGVRPMISDLLQGTVLYAPTHAYWVPILESLVELGGRAQTDTVLERVERKMQGALTPADYEFLPSGVSVRWKNRAQWQRKNMVQQGLLRADSPRGVWEITPEGRKWLEARRKKSA